MAVRFITGLVVVVLGSAQLAAQADEWYRRSPRPKDFVVAKMPWNTFTIELPKNWQMAPGRGGILFMVAEKTKTSQPGATIVIEHKQLAFALSSEDISFELAKLEADEAQNNDPAADDFAHDVKDVGGTRFVFITYTRPGFAGRDAVTLYGFVRGDVMFRVICVAPARDVARYQPIFAHVAATFKDTGLRSE